MPPQKKRNKKPNHNNNQQQKNNNNSNSNDSLKLSTSSNASSITDDLSVSVSSISISTDTASISTADCNNSNDIEQESQPSTSTPPIIIISKGEDEVVSSSSPSNNTTTATTNTDNNTTCNLESIYQIVSNISNNVNQIKERVITDEEPDWREMYLIIQREFKLEKKKTELLETKIEELEQEKRLLSERIRSLESRVDTEKKKLVKTFGTIRSGTVRLLNASARGDNDLSTILKDLQNNVENIDTDNSFVNKIGENADALLTKLKSFQDEQPPVTDTDNIDTEVQDEEAHKVSLSHQLHSAADGNGLVTSSSSLPLLSTSINNNIDSNSNGNNSNIVDNAQDIKKIIKVQSQVRKYIVQKGFKRLKTKRLAVNELFETETTYVQHLSNLSRIFVNPLRQKIQSGEIQISVNEVERIFSTINTIIMSNSIFLKQTEDIFKHFNRWSLIGSRMLEQLPLFECYIDYIVNFESSQHALKRAMTVPSFSQFVKSAETNVDLDDLDLADLLIMPVQRIPRYIMLIQGIRKYTPHDHPDHAPLTKALDAFKKFADGVNERKAMRNRAILLDERISGLKDEIANKLGTKYLIREGPIRFKKSFEYAFLLNDMILICHPQIKKSKLRSNSISASQLPNVSSSTSSTASSASSSPSNSTNTSSLSISVASSTSSVGGGLSGSNAKDTPPSSPSPKDADNIHEIVSFKFISKVMLDARVKIVEDSTEPKWTTIIPDLYSIELTATSTEERQLWVKDIMNIISIFSNNLLNNPTNSNNATLLPTK